MNCKLNLKGYAVCCKKATILERVLRGILIDCEITCHWGYPPKCDPKDGIANACSYCGTAMQIRSALKRAGCETKTTTATRKRKS